MTSIYHRRFYPNDVDGTVAYVAPQDVNNNEDSAYDKFFTKVGDDPACRAALNNVQIEALHRRTELVGEYAAWATENQRTFTIVHNADVPATTASSDDILAWMDAIYGLDSNTEQGIEGFIPYYYQAASQLGYPFVTLPHLKGLQHYRGQDVAQSYIPASLHPRFEPLAMLDIDLWVKLASQQLLFVYGGGPA